MRTITIIALSLLAGCATTTFDADEAAMADSVEFRINGDGSLAEIEYHVAVSRVPNAVHEGWRRLYPANEPTGAEKEISDGDVYWELMATIDGRKVEVMFLPDGTMWESEVEVDPKTVPAPALDAIRRMFPQGRTKGWEVIRDSGGKTQSWHAKVSHDGTELKLVVMDDGSVTKMLREAPAEMEVPLRSVRTVGPSK